MGSANALGLRTRSKDNRQKELNRVCSKSKRHGKSSTCDKSRTRDKSRAQDKSRACSKIKGCQGQKENS